MFYEKNWLECFRCSSSRHYRRPKLRLIIYLIMPLFRVKKDFIKKDNIAQLEKEWQFAPYQTVSLESRDDLTLKARMIKHPKKVIKLLY